MDETVKDTWRERGWLAEGEDLVKMTNPADNTKTPKTTVNTKAANRIVKQYTDKWQLDNNVKVEWTEGQINGADGNTLATSYHGRKVKDNQIAIDKKKLQIKELEDKITRIEEGIEEAPNPLSKLKEQLRIANKELEKLTKTPDIHPNITIQINKNAKHPHAILRSELEHARDIAKRTVPNQKAQHFSRYSGINESEMSLGYVKKKADSRVLKAKTEAKIKVDNEKYNYDIQKGNDPNLVTSKGKSEYTFITVRTKDDKPLGSIRYHDMGDNTFFVDMMENWKGGGGFVRTAVAKILKENPDKKVYWQAISDSSVSSYEKFCEEYPYFVKRVELEDVSPSKQKEQILDELFDIQNEKVYTSEKEVLKNGEKTNNNKPINETGQNISRGDISTDNTISRPNREGTGNTGGNGDTSYGDNTASHQNSNGARQTATDGMGTPIHTGSEGEIPTNTQKVQQSNSRPISERLTATDGDLNEVDNIVAETVAKDTELSGTTWKDLAENAEELYERLEAYGMKNLEALKGAFKTGDVDFVNSVTAKALAAERLVGNLREQAAAVMKQNGDITEIAESLAYLSDYTSKLASALGRGLNEVKVVNKARTFFSLTTLEKQGLENFTDLLYTDITSLNFRRNAKEIKAELYSKIQKYVGGEFFNELMANSGLRKNFDEVINKILKQAKEGSLSPDVVNKELQGLVKKTQMEDVKNAVIFANDNKGLMKAMKYLIHILSI